MSPQHLKRNNIILLVSPAVDCQRNCALARFVLQSHATVGIKLCIIESETAAAAQKTFNQVYNTSQTYRMQQTGWFYWDTSPPPASRSRWFWAIG